MSLCASPPSPWLLTADQPPPPCRDLSFYSSTKTTGAPAFISLMGLADMDPTSSLRDTGVALAVSTPTSPKDLGKYLFWHGLGGSNNVKTQVNLTAGDGDADGLVKLFMSRPSQGSIEALKEPDTYFICDFPMSNQELKGACTSINDNVPMREQHAHAINWDMLSTSEAVDIFDRSNCLHSVENIINLLQKTRKSKTLFLPKVVHPKICANGLEDHKIVGNYVVPMFVECGSVSSAQHISNKLIYHNEYSWTALMLGYLHSGNSEHVLRIYEEMLENDAWRSSYTIVALVLTYGEVKEIEKGIQIHIWITKTGLEDHIFIGSALIDVYAKCGMMLEAQNVSEKLPVQGLVSWNALLAGYAEHGPFNEVLKCITEMQLEEIVSDAVTYACCLKACAKVREIEKVQKLCGDIV